jgi:cobalamin biosynthesis protein CobC
MDSGKMMWNPEEPLRYHGGNINAAGRQFPDAPTPWIDLSTGINPVPYPVTEFPLSSLSRLPESSEQAALEAAAAKAYGAALGTEIVAVPGTQALIQLLPRVVLALRVGILGPTYGEHEKCWRAAGAEIVPAASLSDFDGCDVGVVVNPNNPDGRLLSLGELRQAATQVGTLIVDEAFMDVVQPSASLAPVLPANAVLLRSVGKAYGLAGLRLGFAVAHVDLGARLRAALGPWAVSGPAIAIGQRALADSAWLADTIQRLSAESSRLDRLVTTAGFTIIGGTPLFRLGRSPNAGDWFIRLAEAGILVRPFDTDPGLLRFGIPHALSDWERLEAALCSSSTILQR